MVSTSSDDFTCQNTDKVKAFEDIDGAHKSIDDVLCNDLWGGRETLVEKVKEVFEGFNNNGLIASAKKLDMVIWEHRNLEQYL